ncbi:GlxA family transcriptional regulator [Chitinimonas sp. BJB300]|uniref:GlxA family transcriptional regulator n=1 Tax=Chitinimonas sp. BJB300 TaxID=1559339 RepID=UPI000C0CD61D|nr:GlxA family transcriptional regulator [Chitinimonas sp. BJB300]PHV11756.1 AraC family transcriptional regulator [Chitinimonas sp. BJB300]TSJ87105.1 GlxA family transcriptional regulator [Chitinimonas sp. BJB300]
MFDYADKPLTQRLGVLLLPGFLAGELGLLQDCVGEANRLAEATLYQLVLLSMEGEPVLSRQGRAQVVDEALRADANYPLLFVAASEHPKSLSVHDPVVAALVMLGRQQGVIGAWHAGAFWLAAAGLLNQCRATVHWSLLESFSNRHGNVIASSALFEVDKDRATCGGGMAIADMFLHLLARHHTTELAASVAEHLLLERIRGRDDRQRIPLSNRVGSNQPRLVQAVMLMEANLEEPLTTDEIAQHVCVSRRQLERLFKQHLDRVPSQYYLELRLNRARQMLRQTSGSIIQIGLSCGFSSGPHFSSAYRNHFAVTPREDRQRGSVRSDAA